MREFDFNDDLSTVLDQSLSAPGLREEYEAKKNHEWILKVEGEALQDGLSHLNRKQIAIIEGLFFKDMCLEDICQTYCMTHEELQREIQNMRIRLTRG